MERCSICGRFCKPFDCAIPFGSYLDAEPPEPEFLCSSCVKKVKETHLREKWLPASWIPAKWEHEVAMELGFIRIRLFGAAWGLWQKQTEEIPKGYEQVIEEVYETTEHT